MSNLKKNTFRGVRKGAHISRRTFSKAANLSNRVEQKAHRIINGTDPAIQIHDSVLFEQVYAEALPEIVPIHPALPLAGRPAAVTLFIPSLQKSSFFGGTATALIFSVMLAQKNKMPLRVVETLKHGNAKVSELEVFFTDNNVSFSIEDIDLINLSGRKYNHYGYLDIHPDDIFIASAWWDAYLLQKLPLEKKFIYLIQDYEPIFYNNSDQFTYAEATYHSNSFIPVCNTELMYKFMAKKGYSYIESNGLYFEPAVNIGKKVGISEPKGKADKKRIFIYGRPSVHRNLFYSALSCVNHVFANNLLPAEDWEVFMAGQDNLPDITLDGGKKVKNLGKMSIEDYYEFAKTVDVAVSFMMAPHPSYPPLELASLGAAVVTTAYEDKQDLSKYSKNIIVSQSVELEELSEALLKAAAMPHSARIKNAKQCMINGTWQESLDSLITKASHLLKNERH